MSIGSGHIISNLQRRFHGVRGFVTPIAQQDGSSTVLLARIEEIDSEDRGPYLDGLPG